ncbi:hypothetical protein [Francisella-like endosymbiont]|uniref:hypothetical protein n=1 Tax=Francisella-like endosymbiont TaxID=512373 RepID=UPI00296ED0C7
MAGKRIFHSEYNLENEVLLFYQIWIEPRQKYYQTTFTTVVSSQIKIGLNIAKTGDAMKVVNENEIIIEFIEDSEVILIRCCKKVK